MRRVGGRRPSNWCEFTQVPAVRVQEPKALANELVGMYRKKPLHGLHPFSMSPSHSRSSMEKVKVLCVLMMLHLGKIIIAGSNARPQTNYSRLWRATSWQPVLQLHGAGEAWSKFGRTSEILRWNLYHCHYLEACHTAGQYCYAGHCRVWLGET